MMIQIWDGKEWVNKLRAGAEEVEEVVKMLKEGGLVVMVVPEAFPKKKSNLEENIIKALFE